MYLPRLRYWGIELGNREEKQFEKIEKIEKIKRIERIERIEMNIFEIKKIAYVQPSSKSYWCGKNQNFQPIHLCYN
jgi:hypothetical protein